MKPDPGLSGKPNLRPNKKKDLGALGMSSDSSIKVTVYMHTYSKSKRYGIKLV